jgi:AP2 domain
VATAYAEIRLNGDKAKGRSALISLDDYAEVIRYRWHIWEDPRRNYDGGPYAIAHIWRENLRTTVQMHTLVAQAMGGTGWQRVDHQNFNGLDNRRENLRDGTKGNTHNQRPRTGVTSKYKGVSWHKPSAKWWARITVEGKTRSLGLYHDEADAGRAYNEAALRLFGEYAHLNVIDQEES